MSALALPSPIKLTHLSPYHPYTSRQHQVSPRTPHFHRPSTFPLPVKRKRDDLPVCFIPFSTSDQRNKRTRILPPTSLSNELRREHSPHPDPTGSRSQRSSCDVDPQGTEISGVPLIPSSTLNFPTSPVESAKMTSTVPIAHVDSTNGFSSDFASSSSTDSPSPSSNIDSSYPEFIMPATQPLRRTASPPSFPMSKGMKRPNPKRLSLTIPNATSSSPPSVATPTPFATPVPTSFDHPSADHTPYTPGPPQTPTLAMSMSLGSSTKKGSRRPSLLTLVTQNASNYETPLVTANPYATMRQPKLRLRSSTADSIPTTVLFDKDHKSAHRHPRPFTISESHDQDHDHDTLPILSKRSSSPSTSSGYTSGTASGSTSPSSSMSPPLTSVNRSAFPSKTSEPYEDGPVEVVPGVFLGAETSATDLHWLKGDRIRILNVAQEIEDPFASLSSCRISSIKGKEKIRLADYDLNEAGTTRRIEYCHLKWSHGEADLAQLPTSASLRGFLDGTLTANEDKTTWGLWDAVMWLEAARREGVPVLIHCQCGISRSATMLVAYLMVLAIGGLVPERLGHLKGMQDTYDMAKRQSPWIGPNVSLVFQLVEFRRNLTDLFTKHLAEGTSPKPQTSWPTLADVALSEAEWAQQRQEFEDQDREEAGDGPSPMKLLASPLSPEEADNEAKRLDEEMERRLRSREWSE